VSFSPESSSFHEVAWIRARVNGLRHPVYLLPSWRRKRMSFSFIQEERPWGSISSSAIHLACRQNLALWHRRS
jgi:hypothetical protein